MERLNRRAHRFSSAEAVAVLRIGAACAVAGAVLVGRADYGAGFFATLALALAYTLVLGVRAVRWRPEPRGLAIPLADVTLLLALVAFSGGAASEARLALVVYPVAMGLARPARAIALATAYAGIGFVVASASSLGSTAADTAFAETLAALLVVGAIGVALARAVQRRTAQIKELGAERAALLHEALDAEERERARIGERLHDDTLQSLLAAQQDVREARSGYLQSLEYADEALSEAVRALRDTVTGLHPASLADRGLAVALDVELDRAARRTQLEVQLHVDPEAAGPHDSLLYAVGRELITNAVKHAAATRLEVRLERTAEGIVLTVGDDGLGMVAESRPEEALAAGHVGLASTRQRVGAAGGRLTVESAPGEGTTICVSLPVQVAERDAVEPGGQDDPARIEALRATGLLDGPVHESFDGIARLAARLLDAPVAIVSLLDVDREFLVAHVGVPQPHAARRGWPLTHSLARYAIANNAPLVVTDARADPVLRDSLATVELGVVAYAAVPLTTAAGHPIGVLSVADRRSRGWSEEQLELLHELARVARREILSAGERGTRGDRGGDEVEAERRFIAAVLESLGEGVIASDERGELRIVNAAARRYGDEDSLALGGLADRGELFRAATGKPVTRDELPLPRALRGEDVADEEYLAGDPAGRRRWLVLAGRPIAASSGARGAIMTIRDVTEQRLAQAASLEAEERFRVAFDHAPVGMGIAGLDGRFWSANLALAKLTGWRLERLRDRAARRAAASRRDRAQCRAPAGARGGQLDGGCHRDAPAARRRPRDLGSGPRRRDP